MRDEPAGIYKGISGRNRYYPVSDGRRSELECGNRLG